MNLILLCVLIHRIGFKPLPLSLLPLWPPPLPPPPPPPPPPPVPIKPTCSNLAIYLRNYSIVKNEQFSRHYPLVIRISRDVHVYVLDITVNFKVNKRKSKKAAQTPLGELSALPQTPLLSRDGARPLPYHSPPVVNIFIRPPLSKILDPPLRTYLPCCHIQAIISPASICPSPAIIEHS